MPEFCIEEVKCIDERIEMFWNGIKDHYSFIVNRSKEDLNWRYCDPRAGCFVVKQAEEGGRILGYSALRVNRYREDYPVGFIVDLLTLPNRLDVADALVKDAVRYFDDENINIVNYQVVKNHLVYWGGLVNRQ